MQRRQHKHMKLSMAVHRCKLLQLLRSSRHQHTSSARKNSHGTCNDSRARRLECAWNCRFILDGNARRFACTDNSTKELITVARGKFHAHRIAQRSSCISRAWTSSEKLNTHEGYRMQEHFTKWSHRRKWRNVVNTFDRHRMCQYARCRNWNNWWHSNSEKKKKKMYIQRVHTVQR